MSVVPIDPRRCQSKKILEILGNNPQDTAEQMSRHLKLLPNLFQVEVTSKETVRRLTEDPEGPRP